MILAIIQARMSSTRLPGKVMMPLMGKPVIHHVVDQATGSKHIENVVLATTSSASDDSLAKYVREQLGRDVFRGSEDDVLDRYYNCARQYPCHLVVRICADDLLKDTAVIDRSIALMLEDPSLDYCSNTIKPTYPEGQDIETFKFAALENAFRNARLPSEREHVTPYIWKHPELFKLRNFEYPEDLTGWRWTLDRPADFDFMTEIYKQFYRGTYRFPIDEVVSYIKKNPHLADINRGIPRNEGYKKSLEKEMT